MGDRTYVSLYVPIACEEETIKVIKAAWGEFNIENKTETLCAFGFEEVNYGELDFLPQLKERGIAYDSDWGSGGSYGAGSEMLRFTPEGEAKCITVYDEDRGIDICKLMSVLEDHAALKKVILEEAQNKVPLPWDNQVEYGKIYRTRKLIDPTIQ